MKRIILFVGILLSTAVFAETGCFLAAEKNQTLAQEGNCSLQHSPCSTFKIAISLMGFNEGILIDEKSPELPFKEGYVDYLEKWKQPHNPSTWMQNSNVWYSQVITNKLGFEKFRYYINKFKYGNQNIVGDKGKNNGLTNSWLSSSLKISGAEQVAFLQKLLANKLPVSNKSQELTKKILFVEQMPGGWELYGKTGSGNILNIDGSPNEDCQIGWFVGWLQKDNRTITFAHYIQDEQKVDTSAGRRAKEEAKKKLLALINE